MYLPTVIVPKPQSPRRFYASKSPADTIVEEIQELSVLHFNPVSLIISLTGKKPSDTQQRKTKYVPLPSSPTYPTTSLTLLPKFEIASEETDKKSVYAEEDRTAAQEELAKLKSAFEKAVIGQEGKEVGRRVGGRIRELERAVEAMRERALEE